MSETITTAGQLLKELNLFRAAVGKGNHSLHSYITNHFSLSGRIPWQVGIVRFEQTVDRARRDLDILPPDRQEKYKSTLAEIKQVVSPGKYHDTAANGIRAAISELSIERLENFNDSLLLAGRSFSLEDARVQAVIQTLSSLLSEVEAEPSEIDEAIVPRITDLIAALERYSLFGAEGVKDYVAMLVGAALTRGMEISGPLPDSVKARINKVLGVSKAAMDGFVYLATGAQSIEWAGAHLSLLAAPV